ncbi:MAG: cytidylate kinase-like family protein [Deltaproteobacteria bacterium]|nr:cytidylate kinase-like family protein [Deltaproteobacteria bacterium]
MKKGGNMNIGNMELNRIVEEQIKKWEISKERRKSGKEVPSPVITISRQPGSIVNELVQRLSKELKLDIIDSKIIHEVAESVRMSEKVVSHLDEKTRNVLDNWIVYLKATRFLLTDNYVYHLTKVIGAIGEQGGAIIIGRGANLILPPDETLRVRFIAPMETKVRHMVQEFNITEGGAKQRIVLKEAERRDSVRRYFKVNIEDPINYDLIINTEFLGVENIIGVIKSALKFKKTFSRRKNDE